MTGRNDEDGDLQDTKVVDQKVYDLLVNSRAMYREGLIDKLRTEMGISEYMYFDPYLSDDDSNLVVKYFGLDVVISREFDAVYLTDRFSVKVRYCGDMVGISLLKPTI